MKPYNIHQVLRYAGKLMGCNSKKAICVHDLSMSRPETKLFLFSIIVDSYKMQQQI